MLIVQRFLLLVLFLFSSPSMGADEFELIENTSDVTVRENTDAKKLEIFVGSVKYSLPLIPDAEEMRTSLGIEESESRAFENYESLPLADKKIFLQRRANFLKYLAAALTMSNLAVGVGTYIGDTFRFLKKISIKAIQPALGKWGQKIQAESERDIQLRHRLLYQRLYGPIASVLHSINNQLWYQAHIVAHPNEFGIEGAIAAIGEHGIAKSGIGGLEDIGFSIKYNSQIKGIVFEIYHNPEYFKSSVSVTSIMGLNVKLGLVFGTAVVPSPLKHEKGFTFYPPGVPGFAENRGNSYAAGFSTSFGWPVGPGVAEVQGWLNYNEMRPLLHLEVSPFRMQFIKITTYSPRSSVVHLWSRFKDTLIWIEEKIKQLKIKKPQLGPAYCRRLLAA